MESINPIDIDPMCGATATATTFFMDDCRACTNRKNTIFMKRLFSTDDHDNILELFSLWTSLEVKQSDGLPTYICDECYKLIIDFKKFRIMCTVSDRYFRSKINHSKLEFYNDIIDDPEDYHTDFKTVMIPSVIIENEAVVSYSHNVIHDKFYGHSITEETIITSDIDIKKENHYDLEINHDDDDDDDEDLNKILRNETDLPAKIVEDCKKNIQRNEDIKLSSSRNLTTMRQKKRPIKKVKKNKHEKLSCEKCSKVFLKKHNLEGHLRQHLGLKPCLCTVCGKSYSKWSGLKSHINNAHSSDVETRKDKEYICDFPECKKIHLSYQALTAHKRLVHIQTVNENFNKPIIMKPRLMCELCGKSFRTNGQLTKHKYTHTGLMPFQCKLCPKKFPTNHKLKEHMMRHEGIKNHVCSFCGLRKTTAYELKVHVNYHTREKLHNCKYCSMVFTSASNMTLHIRTVHCGIKAYACTHCDRSFGKPGTLKHHIMTHTGEKPHVCSICGKRFIQPQSLKAHIKTHNNKTIANKSKYVLSEPQ